jgi:hypothetical protein
MEKELQQLIDELGDAINSSLSESERFAEVMAQMEQAGYNVYVLLEASIGVKKNGESEFESAEAEIHVSAQREQDSIPRTQLTATDLDFLKDLKISVA